MTDLKDETIYLSADKVFYTLEGEGEYVGMPSVFMRMAMCNLTCAAFKSDDSPYGCDSYISWSVKNKMTFYQIKCLLEDEGYKEHLLNGAIFKLTGGEPMIQQGKLLKFMDYLKCEWGWVPRIDFETNATIQPDERWLKDFQATFTTSPKLKSNGDPRHKRYVEEVLEWHAMHNSGFKFVVQGKHDMEEIISEYVDKFDIPSGRVWLMPCCGSRQEHINIAPKVAELAKEYHFNFSPRLHLLIWDKALLV